MPHYGIKGYDSLLVLKAMNGHFVSMRTSMPACENVSGNTKFIIGIQACERNTLLMGYIILMYSMNFEHLSSLGYRLILLQLISFISSFY